MSSKGKQLTLTWNCWPEKMSSGQLTSKHQLKKISVSIVYSNGKMSRKIELKVEKTSLKIIWLNCGWLDSNLNWNLSNQWKDTKFYTRIWFKEHSRESEISRKKPWFKLKQWKQLITHTEIKQSKKLIDSKCY